MGVIHKLEEGSDFKEGNTLCGLKSQGNTTNLITHVTCKKCRKIIKNNKI